MGEPPFAMAGSCEAISSRKALLLSEGLLTSQREVIEERVLALVAKALTDDRSDVFTSMRSLRVAFRELANALGLRTQRPSVSPTKEEAPAPTADHERPRAMSIPVSPLASSSVPAPSPKSATDPSPPPSFSASSSSTASSASSDLADFLHARVELLDREKHALTELLERGTVDAIAWRVARLLTRAESSKGRDSVAIEALRLLEIPTNLTMFAERLLTEDAVTKGPYLERILTQKGHACARALWTARVSRSGSGSSPEARARFIEWMKMVGAPAREVLRVALMKLAPFSDTARHADLIEDVLLALPSRCDDDLLAVIATFAKSPAARVRELALSSMARALD